MKKETQPRKRIMVAIDEETHETLSRLAEMEQRTLGAIVLRAIKTYRETAYKKQKW